MSFNWYEVETCSLLAFIFADALEIFVSCATMHKLKTHNIVETRVLQKTHSSTRLTEGGSCIPVTSFLRSSSHSVNPRDQERKV
jgi:hypothetical protein